MTPDLAAPLCGVKLVDYGEERGNALLIGSGCGTMMAIMDAVPAFRWCFDMDAGGSALDLAILTAPSLDFIGIAGWFSITDPADFREILRLKLACPVVAYGGNVALGCATLEEFLRACNERGNVSRPKVEPRRELEWTRVG